MATFRVRLTRDQTESVDPSKEKVFAAAWDKLLRPLVALAVQREFLASHPEFDE
jgi:hypothetical protein